MSKSYNRVPRVVGGYFEIYNNRAERLGRFLSRHWLKMAGAAILIYIAIFVIYMAAVPMPIDYN